MAAYSGHVRAAAAAAAAIIWTQAVTAAPANLSTSPSDVASTAGSQQSGSCYFLPQDAQWPSQADWRKLNQSVGGRLIQGKPLAQRCHGADYNAAACADIRARWTEPLTYFVDPVNVMSPYWLNNSCSPFTAPEASCTLGNIASYAINVSNAQDVIAGFKFAKEKNIRLTVKNTGHDYIGRSNGEGSLALWTHNLKGVSFQNYTSPSYSGPAAKVSAGAQFFEIYKAAGDRGLRIMGGYCPTVGMAGGFVQGAGHGPLAATYGLAADNTLEFDVVTSDGRRLTATKTKNKDLYWALSGGGPGTYAVVLSVTTKAHPDGIVAGGSFTIDNTHDDSYWAAIAAWHRHLLVLDRIHGFNTVWGFTNASFNLAFATWPGHDASETSAALAPFFQEISTLPNITVTAAETQDHTSFYDHYEYYTGAAPYGPYTTNDIIGGRLIPRSTAATRSTDFVALLRNISRTPGLPSLRINGISNNVTHARAGNTPGANAVLPAWRDSLYWLNIDILIDPASPTAEIKRIQAQMNDFQHRLRAFTPGGGAYINEATWDNPDWKEDYFGPNYGRLLSVKAAYDAGDVLYAHTSVGSEAKVVAADGRTCKRRNLPGH
ncbi:hypothetical protein B0T17DRAFT_586963 [Bombardia bombarda]|uniref:FAD-binding PCMH-type domain-containing protein n=1 Tax=Bombardia bombarda TaxID=252184 RepID=A0AA39XK40_9PEZI|nr:hypothetical protein B0T17DRAFT_586963 [Bombardia bombarda]